ncbi:hypothetical protein [Aureimonas glaciei]|jgi:hypothetical protein|uniref:Uncharacterized protein n=1 Tax=Aureimonas glaciei TaxID=1776957 RepID=A0A916Y5V0_9HYPH|nr:hypothetical protein [Aureimonas glaciei]GGD31977.1 hypothetical protein GCM10011335_38800 [Aureimonas glaciei]
MTRTAWHCPHCDLWHGPHIDTCPHGQKASPAQPEALSTRSFQPAQKQYAVPVRGARRGLYDALGRN